MKRLFILLTGLVFTIGLAGQDAQDLVSQCALGVGENTTSIKDFVIRLPLATDKDNIPVHKANMYLMKNQTYRFTMCNADESEGELIFALYDKQKLITTSYIAKSGNIYNSVDFTCNKTGLYQLWYSFKDGAKGYGTGIVSVVR